MIVEFESTPLFEQLDLIVSNLGYRLVEANSSVKPKGVQVHVVIFRKGGVDLNDCARVTRAITSTLEAFYESREIWLEVSSPGLERQLKTWREFEIFSGLPARIYRNGGDWESTTLGPNLVRQDILKAKLDLLGEVDRE